MNEKTFWMYLRDKMKGLPLLLQRIESGGTSRGVPDVAFSSNGLHGWIELKYISGWPTRPSTQVKIPSLSAYQKLWLDDHYAYGGSTYLLLRVGLNEFLLFEGDQVANLGSLTRNDMIQQSKGYWKPSINAKELWKIIAKNTIECKKH